MIDATLIITVDTLRTRQTFRVVIHRERNTEITEPHLGGIALLQYCSQ